MHSVIYFTNCTLNTPFLVAPYIRVHNNKYPSVPLAALISPKSSNCSLLQPKLCKKFETSSSRIHDEEDDSDDEDIGESFLIILRHILTRYPKAARIVNSEGMLPVELAILAGRTWHNGIEILLTEFAQGLAESLRKRDANPNIFPLLFSKILQFSANAPESTNLSERIIYKVFIEFPEFAVEQDRST